MIRPTIFASVMILAVTAASAADILDELRQGQHFDRSQLSDTGPRVLARALEGDAAYISLLGRYFENGERGFPAANSVAQRLYQKGYDTGNWPSALNLAKLAERKGELQARYDIVCALVQSCV